MNKDLKLIADTKCVIGESPSWDAKNACLYWVDIIGKKVYKYDSLTGKISFKEVNKYVSYVVPREKAGVAIGMQDGFYSFDFETAPKLLSRPENYNSFMYRFNDGKCDAKGRIWAGTTSFYEESHECSLYSLDPDLKLEEKVEGVAVSNGLGWSPKNEKMYYIDSFEKIVFVYDFDLDKGELLNGQILIDFKDQGANPDGMTVDEEGMLWIAHWGGHELSRWNPATKKKIESIKFPVKKVTSCVFGGENLDELYVTTARFGADGEELENEPLSGGVFRINPGVKGLPTFSFKG